MTLLTGQLVWATSRVRIALPHVMVTPPCRSIVSVTRALQRQSSTVMQDWAIRRTPAAFRNAFARPTKGMAFVTAVETSANRAIGVWMAGMSAAVFGMVAVGGYTRLTRSGLSMTEWRLTGSKLPDTEEEWAAEFEKFDLIRHRDLGTLVAAFDGPCPATHRYKAFPEYQKLNQSMTLNEFKDIYFWEWFHRMWGRSLGLLFAVPCGMFLMVAHIRPVFFLCKRKSTRSAILTGGLGPRLALLFTLGGTQGLVGWWMVKSGLDHTHIFGLERPETDMPRVSPYRLATHLSFAFVTYGLLSWTAMDLLSNRASVNTAASNISMIAKGPDGLAVLRRLQMLNRGAVAVCSIAGITIFSGAFVAGNLAGLSYGDWPLMGGQIIPDDIARHWEEYKPAARNLFENVAMVQFDHRMLAYTTIAATTALWLASRGVKSYIPKSALNKANLLFGAVWAQGGIGVATILMNVPVSLGVVHQAGALTVWTCSLWFLHSLRAVRLASSTATTGMSAATTLAAMPFLSRLDANSAIITNHKKVADRDINEEWEEEEILSI